MTDVMRGMDDVLHDVIEDLRDYQPLVDLLPERQAIYVSHPPDDRGYAAAVTVTPIPAGSTPHRDVQERRVRLQVTCKSTDQWRRDQPAASGGGLMQMANILSHVGDRLDKAKGVQEVAQGGAGTAEPTQMNDGRLALIGDWRVAGWYSDMPD